MKSWTCWGQRAATPSTEVEKESCPDYPRAFPFCPVLKDVPVVLLNQSIIISARLLADLSTAKIALGLMLSKKRFCRRSDDEDLLAAQAKFILPILRHLSVY